MCAVNVTHTCICSVLRSMRAQIVQKEKRKMVIFCDRLLIIELIIHITLPSLFFIRKWSIILIRAYHEKKVLWVYSISVYTFDI
jgi:hypothetical protein